MDRTGTLVVDPRSHDVRLFSRSGAREAVLREGDEAEVVGAVVGMSAVPQGMPMTYRDGGQAPLVGPATLWVA